MIVNSKKWNGIDSTLTVIELAGYHLPEPEPSSGAATNHCMGRLSDHLK